ncbi:MAG TPA: asparagine synthase-related protein [Pyrinomonadaceae bacterium]|nr:asparagine synthase-related protein [Pyrinomonadaceae bacterium]
MCGFIGRISRAEKSNLSAGLEFIGRRGPDSHREWSSADGQVGLLHARLAIVDTDSQAHQPFTDNEHGVTVAFNGEIYNYLNLRAECSDYEFKTRSDTEVIIALYVTRGLLGLRKLRGMFGLCLVDERARRVFLARDPIGKKPLFLGQWSEGVFFGSSVLALLTASSHEANVATESVPEFWEQGHIASDRSFVEGCKPISPGQVIELDWHGQVRGVDSCIPETETATTANLQEVKERVADLVRQAVERRLTNNANPVSLLSGGIDSTVVTSHMRTAGDGSSITLGTWIPGANDEKFARYAAERLQIPLQVMRSKSNDLGGDVAWALDLQDEPLGMISFFPLALMIRTAKEYGRILLTGDGGDEVFLGYGQPQDWLKSIAGNGTGKRSLLPAAIAAPSWMSDWGTRSINDSLLGHMFTKLDRASAEQGVEARCPLLDWDLVSFVRSLPPEFLFFDGQPKALLKAQLPDWPKSFVNRPKVGFAYNLRWAWGLRRFAGLRELVTAEAVDLFAKELPRELRGSPRRWSSRVIFQNFSQVWKVLTWSRFAKRLQRAAVVAREHSQVASLEITLKPRNISDGSLLPPPTTRPSTKSDQGRVCIITSATICCNPRVVKEADALSAAGFDVRVVASQHIGWAADWDAQLMVNRPWKLDSVRWDYSNGEAKRIRLTSGIRQQGFALISRASNSWGTAERAYSRLFDEQLRLANLESADLFIAHNPQALPVAAAAAKQGGVNYAFDSEDYHYGEFAEEQQRSTRFRLLSYLEPKYLPKCAYVTVPSQPIAEALVQRYGISPPTTIHNVFPWSDRSTLDGEVKDRQDRGLSLYWYSQVVGLDRGLQDAIRALSLLSGEVLLHVRGRIGIEVQTELLRLASEHSVANKIIFHQTVPPTELLSRTAEHDVGLALEQNINENKNLTVANKVFFYLLAGLAVAATNTTGQRDILKSCPDAGFLYSPGDYRALAGGLQRFINSPPLLQAAKKAALKSARDRWNWERESQQLVSLVSGALTQVVPAER